MPAATIGQAIDAALRHLHAGDVGAAESICRQVLSARPGEAAAVHVLGLVAYQRGEFDRAITLLERSVTSGEPVPAAYLINLGKVLAEANRRDEAARAFRRALELDPRSAEAHNNVGALLEHTHMPDAAVDHFRQAIELRPGWVEAHSNLSNALRKSGRVEEAVAAARAATAIDPESAAAWNSLGSAHYDAGELARAVECFEASVRLRPESPDGRLGLATSLLVQGDFGRGLAAYESRLDSRHWAHLRRPPLPLWDGSDPRGRTILLRAEQALGDTIQFVRYAPVLAGLGARVHVECQRPLKTLLRGVTGVESVVARGEPLPPADTYVPMMSVPQRLGETVSTISAPVAYLRADPAHSERWRRELEPLKGFRVGLAWQTDPTHPMPNRSCPLVKFEPLALPGVRLVSLQKFAGVEQIPLATGRFELAVPDLAESAGAFTDTAAVVRNLDLVITVDTALAHLAGALGVPTWVLLPQVPDWRWLVRREDTPWYPNARLFRQARRGDWDEVLRRVAARLQVASGGGGGGTRPDVGG